MTHSKCTPQLDYILPYEAVKFGSTPQEVQDRIDWDKKLVDLLNAVADQLEQMCPSSCNGAVFKQLSSTNAILKEAYNVYKSAHHDDQHTFRFRTWENRYAVWAMKSAHFKRNVKDL